MSRQRAAALCAVVWFCVTSIGIPPLCYIVFRLPDSTSAVLLAAALFTFTVLAVALLWWLVIVASGLTVREDR